MGRVVRSIVAQQIETKRYEEGLTVGGITGSTVYPVFSLAEGTGQDERVGQRVKLTGIHMTFGFVCMSPDVTLVRVVVYRTSSLYNAASFPLTNIINNADRDLFQVKMDRQFYLTPTLVDGSTRVFSFHWRARAGSGGSAVVYDGNTFNSTVRGQWYTQVLFSNGSTIAPSMNLQREVFFKDG